MKIYLDVCCLNRPFDDHSQDRIHLESEAILRILDRCEKGEWNLIGSEAIDFEISKIPNPDRKEKVLILAKLAKIKIQIDEEIKNKAKQLQNYGIKPLDALHLACAEKGNVDIFLSTDDDLISKVIKEKIVKIKVENPMMWLMEIIKNESDEP